jgi:phenylalanyl-tRNA synthetase beta chain
MSRDIALWVTADTAVGVVESVLKTAAGPLCVRISLFDTFTKDNRTSNAFRIVFQALDRTLTDSEVNGAMENVYQNAQINGWEVR